MVWLGVANMLQSLVQATFFVKFSLEATALANSTAIANNATATDRFTGERYCGFEAFLLTYLFGVNVLLIVVSDQMPVFDFTFIRLFDDSSVSTCIAT